MLIIVSSVSFGQGDVKRVDIDSGAEPKTENVGAELSCVVNAKDSFSQLIVDYRHSMVRDMFEFQTFSELIRVELDVTVHRAGAYVVWLFDFDYFCDHGLMWFEGD